MLAAFSGRKGKGRHADMRHDAPKADFPNLKQNRVVHASDIQKALIDWLVTHSLNTYGSFLESIPVISPATAGEGQPARTDRTRSFVCSSFDRKEVRVTV